MSFKPLITCPINKQAQVSKLLKPALVCTHLLSMQLRSYLDDRFHIALFACFASTLNGPLFETSFRHSFLGLKQVNSILFWIYVSGLVCMLCL